MKEQEGKMKKKQVGGGNAQKKRLKRNTKQTMYGCVFV